MSVKIEIDAKRAIDRLRKIANNIETIPWLTIGELVRDSVHTNFDAQGRPVRWPGRKDTKSHPLLQKSGRLKNSIYVEEIKDGVQVGSRVPYQAVHNFGYPPRNIPQRKYLMVQPQDEIRIRKTIKNHILKK